MVSESLLDEIAESIRNKRRWGPNFPTSFDLSLITYNAENQTICMDLLIDGIIRKFDLQVKEVAEHGE